jgi:hypothetical protein
VMLGPRSCVADGCAVEASLLTAACSQPRGDRGCRCGRRRRRRHGVP